MVDQNLGLTPQTNMSVERTIECRVQGTQIQRQLWLEGSGGLLILLASVDPALTSAAVACKPELHRMGLAVKTQKQAC